MKAGLAVALLSTLSSGSNLRVPYQAYGYAASADSTSTNYNDKLPDSAISGETSSLTNVNDQSKGMHNTPGLEHSMENVYDQSPRFKAQQQSTVSAGETYGYNTYFHSTHNVAEDRINDDRKLNQKLMNPLTWANDGGAYDAWKAEQKRKHSAASAATAPTTDRSAALLRFQSAQVTLSKQSEMDDNNASEDGASGGASGPVEDELIVAAEDRVAKAERNANTIHTDVVGTELAIKDTLKETSTSVGDAHEQGPASDDVLEHLQKAEKSSRQMTHLREIQKKKEVADANAAEAVGKAKAALAALTEQRRVASEMRNEEQQKAQQHEQDKIDAAKWPPVDGSGSSSTSDNSDESGAADDGSASNDAPKLSKRQQLFKELGERLMRLALPSAKRKELVDHLDDNMNALKKQLHTTEVEKEMFEKKFKELERRRVEEEAKKRGDSSASKMSSGQKLHWIEKELKTATDALTKMGPIADKIASEAAAKKKMDGEEDGEEASLMEEHEAPEIVESIGEPVKEEEEEEETSKPKTVENLSKVKGSDDEEKEIYATVVKDDPTDDESQDEEIGSVDSVNSDSDVMQVPEPVQPVDPTSPGQRSVADQVYDALGGDETFGEAERKANGGTDKTAPDQSLNSEPWKAALEADALPLSSTANEGTTTPTSPPSALENSKEKLEEKDNSLPKLSTTKPSQYGEEEETVARMELVGAKKDAEVAAARVKYAQQRHVQSSQQEQLKTAIKMSAMQDRAVDVKKEYLRKAMDEALVSKNRLDNEERKIQEIQGGNSTFGNTTGYVDGVQLAIRDRLRESSAAREQVVDGRKDDVEKEEKSAKEHKALVKQIQDSIKQEERKEEELKLKRDQEVKEQQVVQEKVADAQAKYGLRHDVQKLIDSNGGTPTSGDAGHLGILSKRTVGDGVANGEVAKTLAKEGKTFSDAAEWRLHLVRTGQAGPLHIPTPSTEHELSAAVGAFVGAKRGASLGATHDLTAAAASMRVAGVEHYPVLLEVDSTFNLDTAADDALREAREDRESRAGIKEGVLSEETLERIRLMDTGGAKRQTTATSSPTTTTSSNATPERFLEVHSSIQKAGKVGSKTATAKGMLQQSAEILKHASMLRKAAQETWKKNKASNEMPIVTTVPSQEKATTTERKVMFHDLPSIHGGDQLFEQTKKWLKTANPFDQNYQLSSSSGNKISSEMMKPSSLSNEERDMFLENSAQFRTGAIMDTPKYNHIQSFQQQERQEQQEMGRGQEVWDQSNQAVMYSQPQILTLSALVAKGVVPDVSSPLPDLM